MSGFVAGKPLAGMNKMINYQSRQVTRKLLEKIEEGVLSEHQVLLACLNYMSEADVAVMAEDNDFYWDGEEEENE